ncbi:MAG: hypothetical protein SPE03_14590 [Treponema sp.]|nr:hypothetical protein [Treponema sp.]
MLKKKLVTIVVAAFCVALVTAQSSGVNNVTTGLIEDGAIDSFKFGTEDGSGVIFGQYNNANQQVVLGWGNLLSDTLWLSVYDAWNFKNAYATETATANNFSTADDGINVDYTTTTRKVEGQNFNRIANTLGIGAGINNTLGFQLVWDANYKVCKNPAGNSTIKEEINNPGTGRNEKKEWTKFANNDISNNFIVNFKGVGIENLGDIDFFAKLNKVYFYWDSINRTGDYTASTTINGKTTSETTITVKNTINTLTPGLNFDLGLNVIDNDIATVKFVYEDDFRMSFMPSTNESTMTVKTPGIAEEITTTNSYKVEYGKYLKWENKFEPKLAAEFNVAKPLKLKAQLALPVTLTQIIDDADKYEKVSQTEIFDRTNGYSYLSDSNPKKTETGRYDPNGSAVQNSDIFSTCFAPKLSAGFVYEVTPGKFNVNFGVSAQPTYTWTTTTLTNANINTVEVTEEKDKSGNVKTSKKVTVNNNGNDETKTTALSASCPTKINLGATWFFTENVRFDAYILSYFGNDSLFSLSSAGASVTVKF